MGMVSKGKRKVTVELSPDTIDALDRETRLYYGTKGRGGIIDDLVSAVLLADTEVAAEVYGYCIQRAMEEGRLARTDDPIASTAHAVKEASFDALRRTLSTSLADDRVDLEATMENSKDCGIRKVNLSGGKSELVPGGTVLLNPDLEGKRAHVWGVWAYDVDAPCDLVGAADGKCIGSLMAYMSDRDDLWKCGQHKPARFVDAADAEDCKRQAAELFELAFEQVDKSGAAAGKTFVIAWAIFDMMSQAKTVPVGTSFPIAKDDGGEKR